MNIYMVMAAAVLLLAVLMRGSLPHNKRYIIIACLLMFALYGLRDAYSIGNDSSSSYLHQFQRMEDTSWTQLWDDADLNNNFIWNATVKLGYELLGGDYQVFIVLISAFVMLVFGRFIYRYSSNPVQSIIYYWGLWFYTFNFNSLKQSIAMALILLAFDAVMERRVFRHLLLVALAALFHFPAAIFLPAYWIVKLNPMRGFLILLGAALLAIYLWRDEIMNFVVQFYYEEHTFQGEDRFLTGKVMVMLALVFVAFVLRPPTRENRVYAATMQFVAIATLIQLFSVYNNVFERLADYYFQFSVVFVPFIFDRRLTDRRNLEKTMMIQFGPYVLGALCLFRFYDIVTRPTSFLMPFQFFFQR